MYTLKVQKPNGIHYFDSIKLISSGRFLAYDKIKSSEIFPSEFNSGELIPSNYCFAQNETQPPSFNYFEFGLKPSKTVIFYQKDPVGSKIKVTVVSFEDNAYLEKDGQTITKI